MGLVHLAQSSEPWSCPGVPFFLLGSLHRPHQWSGTQPTHSSRTIRAPKAGTQTPGLQLKAVNSQAITVPRQVPYQSTNVIYVSLSSMSNHNKRPWLPLPSLISPVETRLLPPASARKGNVCSAHPARGHSRTEISFKSYKSDGQGCYRAKISKLQVGYNLLHHSSKGAPVHMQTARVSGPALLPAYPMVKATLNLMALDWNPKG